MFVRAANQSITFYAYMSWVQKHLGIRILMYALKRSKWVSEAPSVGETLDGEKYKCYKWQRELEISQQSQIKVKATSVSPSLSPAWLLLGLQGQFLNRQDSRNTQASNTKNSTVLHRVLHQLTLQVLSTSPSFENHIFSKDARVNFGITKLSKWSYPEKPQLTSSFSSFPSVQTSQTATSFC